MSRRSDASPRVSLHLSPRLGCEHGDLPRGEGGRPRSRRPTKRRTRGSRGGVNGGFGKYEPPAASRSRQDPAPIRFRNVSSSPIEITPTCGRRARAWASYAPSSTRPSGPPSGSGTRKRRSVSSRASAGRRCTAHPLSTCSTAAFRTGSIRSSASTSTVTPPSTPSGKIDSTIRAAEAQVRVNEWDLERWRQQVRMDVRRAYFGLMLARDASYLVGEVVQQLDKGIPRGQRQDRRRRQERGRGRSLPPGSLPGRGSPRARRRPRRPRPSRSPPLRFLTGVQSSFDVPDEPLKPPPTWSWGPGRELPHRGAPLSPGGQHRSGLARGSESADGLLARALLPRPGHRLDGDLRHHLRRHPPEQRVGSPTTSIASLWRDLGRPLVARPDCPKQRARRRPNPSSRRRARWSATPWGTWASK